MPPLFSWRVVDTLFGTIASNSSHRPPPPFTTTLCLPRQTNEEDVELYDEVTEDQYKSIVRGRLQEDDFVVDDGVVGYMDNGMDDWTGEHDHGADSDEELPKKAKSKKKSNAEAPKNKPKQRAASPVAATSISVSAAEEDNFMNSLLGGMDTVTTSASAIASKVSRKHKQSPEYD
ncbi:hypothetical protein DXG01_009711 [Tephrocybe rancida]|nr:hypothetical protein DXG01_009711 [Tephrocybe rancida]